MSSDDKSVITEMYKEMYRCMISKDIDKLGQLLSDKFVLVHMTGLRQPKPVYLKAIKDGVLNYFSEQADTITVDVHGNTATLCGQSRVSAAVFGGGRGDWRLQLDFKLSKSGGKWLIDLCEASTY